MATTILSLPSLIDLAAAPTQESVTYPVLQSLLHVIVQQLGFNKTKVEFRGKDSEMIQELADAVRTQEQPPMEFKVIPAPKDWQDSKTGKDDESENIVSDSQDLQSESKEKKSLDSEAAFIIESGEIIETEKRKPLQVSYTSFTRLEGKVKQLQAQVDSLGTQVLPSDEVLLSQTRSTEQATPITDLWQAMNITKRMSGAEEGIDKLASLLETVAKEYADLKLLLDKVQDEGLDVVETLKEIRLAADYAKKMRPRAELYEKALIKSREISQKMVAVETEEVLTSTKQSGTDAEHSPALSSASSGGKSESGDEHHQSVTEDVEVLPTEEERVIEEEEGQGDMTPKHDNQPGGNVVHIAYEEKFAMLPDTHPEALKYNNLIMDQELIRRQMEFMTAQINTLADFSEKILPEILEGLPGMEELKKRIAAIRGITGSQATLTSAEWDTRRENLTVEQRVEDLESKVASHSSKLRRQDALFCDKYDTMVNQVRDLTNSVNFIKQQLDLDENNPDSENVTNSENIKMMMEKYDNIVNDLSVIFRELNDIGNDIRRYDQDFGAISAEMEGLQSTKLDRFEIDDILADKADCSEVQGKVSTDVFEEFCNNLTKGVDFTIKNTLDQEKQWRLELSKMIQDVEKKFNTSEVEPLKEEIMNKIEELRKRLEEVAQMKAYSIAAGSKKRLLTEVSCIACDKKAAMAMDAEMNEARKSSDNLKSGKKKDGFLNAKPFVCQELEQLKRMQARNPGAKNLQMQEQIMRNYAVSVGFDLLPEHDVTFVNRYCGGAETLINPRQRVARVPRNNNCNN